MVAVVAAVVISLRPISLSAAADKATAASSSSIGWSIVTIDQHQHIDNAAHANKQQAAAGSLTFGPSGNDTMTTDNL